MEGEDPQAGRSAGGRAGRTAQEKQPGMEEGIPGESGSPGEAQEEPGLLLVTVKRDGKKYMI